MSKTPRTDKFLKNTRPLPSAEWGEKVREFARQLETELADKEKQLAEARAEIEAIVFVKKKAVEEIVFLNQEIERKDKLIERLKCCGNCALKDLTAIPHVLTHPYRDFCAVCKDRSKWHQTIESAALSAAERKTK
jgi:hypothetical protein